MDSINRQQPEHNRSDLSGREAVEKIRQLADSAKSCFMVTAQAIGDSSGVRPMAPQQVDDSGQIWFLSASDSHKNAEITADPRMQLFFQGSPHSDFMTLSGSAEISRDKAKIDELWEGIMKTWFTEGKDDPRITLLRFAPSSGYYWDNKHGDAVAGIKMLIGAAIGKTLDDSIEGRISV